MIPGLPALIGSKFYGVKTHCLEFGDNSTPRYVSFTPTSAITSLSAGTVEMWFRTFTPESMRLFTLGNTSDIQNFFQIWYNVSTKLFRMHVRNVSNPNYNPAFGYEITKDIWYHIAVTSNGSTYNAYLNGVEQTMTFGGTNDGKWFNTLTGINTMHVNRLLRTDDFYTYNNQIDEVRIWNHARTADQIKRYMHTRLIGNPALHTGLVAYYPMDKLREVNMHPDPNEFYTDDYSPNSNHGRVVGATQITP